MRLRFDVLRRVAVYRRRNLSKRWKLLLVFIEYRVSADLVENNYMMKSDGVAGMEIWTLLVTTRVMSDWHQKPLPSASSLFRRIQIHFLFSTRKCKPEGLQISVFACFPRAGTRIREM